MYAGGEMKQNHSFLTYPMAQSNTNQTPAYSVMISSKHRDTRDTGLYRNIKMKYDSFEEGDIVLVYMPQGSGFEHPQKAIVIEKGANGIVLLQKPGGHRWWTNSSRIKLRIRDEEVSDNIC